MGNTKVFMLLCFVFAVGANAREICVPVSQTTLAPSCMLECELNYGPNENCDSCQCVLTQDSCEIDQPGTMLIDCQCVYVDPCFAEPCNFGEKWSFEECRCVPDEITCAPCPHENYYQQPGDCTCYCGLNQEVCSQEGRTFNEGECSCSRIDWGCDYIMECPPGEKWDFGVCGCVPIVCENSEPCGGNYVFDESCQCKCNLNEETCLQEGARFDESQCTCLVDWGCDYIMICPPGQKWDFGVCNCVQIVCDNVAPCEENFVYDENCQCTCPHTEESCSQIGGRFVESECACAPIDMGCDYIMECPLGEKWDFGVCGCVQIVCDNVEPCGENQVFNENCECQCALTAEKCEADFPGSMLLGCGCVYIDPCFPVPCNEGEKWVQDECACVPEDIVCGPCPNENYAIDGSNCQCQCIMTEEVCSQQGGRFVESECLCLPFAPYGCDYILECPVGQVWDGSDSVCACVPRVCENSAPCEGNFDYDENCECKCAMTQDRCDIEHPGTLLVGCDCLYYDPCFEQSCPKGESFDFDQCSCVDSPTSESPNDCIPQSCGNRYVWLPTECTCVCPPMYCEEGTTPGGDCECVPDPNYCSPIECADENQSFDPESCTCI